MYDSDARERDIDEAMDMAFQTFLRRGYKEKRFRSKTARARALLNRIVCANFCLPFQEWLRSHKTFTYHIMGVYPSPSAIEQVHVNSPNLATR
jgi:hypothetical protein